MLLKFFRARNQIIWVLLHWQIALFICLKENGFNERAISRSSFVAMKNLYQHDSNYALVIFTMSFFYLISLCIVGHGEPADTLP